MISKDWSPYQLSEYEIKNSITALNLRRIRQLSKSDLIEILLLREKAIYTIQEKYQKDLIDNKQEVFKALIEENNKIKSHIYANMDKPVETKYSKKYVDDLIKKYCKLKDKYREVVRFMRKVIDNVDLGKV